MASKQTRKLIILVRFVHICSPINDPDRLILLNQGYSLLMTTTIQWIKLN